MTGGKGDPIMPRQIKAGSSWSWDETDDAKVKELRGWWKERCDVQTAATDAAACSSPLKESATNSTSFNATSSEQDQQLKKSGVAQNPLFKLPAPQAQSVSKKQKIGPASSGAAVRQEGRLSGDIRVTALRKFMEVEKLTSFHKHLIAFKDLLLKKGISKVLISGFVNGESGHVRVPESLLGTMADSQLLFVVCSQSTGIPSVTQKLVLARAFGLHIVDSRFLIKWGETTVLPGFEEHPVKNEWASNSTGLLKSLTPLSDKIFNGQTFAFHDTRNWLISPEHMASMIIHLGGKVVSPEEQDNAGFGLSSSPVSGVEVFHPDWLVRMVLAGQDLPNVKWRLVDAEEDGVFSASQVATLHVLHHVKIILLCNFYWAEDQIFLSSMKETGLPVVGFQITTDK